MDVTIIGSNIIGLPPVRAARRLQARLYIPPYSGGLLEELLL